MELETFKITVLPLRGKMLNLSLKLWHIRDRLDEYQCVEALVIQVAKNLSLDKLRTRTCHCPSLPGE